MIRVFFYFLQDEYCRLWELFISGMDVFLVCFSVVDLEILENVKWNWLMEIWIFFFKVFYILVGIKMDM